MRFIDVLGWCPVGSVLPHGEKVPPLALLGHSSSEGITAKLLYGVDVF